MDAVATLRACLTLQANMVPDLKFHEDAMRAAAAEAYSNATDLADYLAAKGLPFREAHDVVGQLVADAIREGVPLEALPLDAFQAASQLIEDDVYDALKLEAVVDRRTSFGGTATSNVKAAITERRKAFEEQPLE